MCGYCGEGSGSGLCGSCASFLASLQPCPDCADLVAPPDTYCGRCSEWRAEADEYAFRREHAAGTL